MNKNTSDMNPVTRTILGYVAMAALVAGTIAVLSPAANAGNAYGRDNNPGNAYGRDNNPGNANGRAFDGGPDMPGSRGRLASAMGSLNAAHASAQGLKHANGRSVVGKLANYMDSLSAYEDLHPRYHDLEADLIDIKDNIETVKGEISYINEKIDEIEADIKALDPEDEKYQSTEGVESTESYEADLAALNEDKDYWDEKLGDKNEKLTDFESNETTTQTDLDAVTADINANIEDAADSLQSAANKDSEIDATVVNAVNELLDGKSEDFTHSDAIREVEEDIVRLINDPA